MMPLWLKRDFRAITYVLASCVFGLIIMRIVAYYLPLPSDTYGQELAGDALFTVCTQVIFFLVVPFCIYKFYGKRTVKQTLEYSSIGKFEPYFLIALPLGIAVCFTTIGVSSVWTGLLRLTGYTVPTPVDNKPQSFVFGYFIVDVLLTAVLPAVCEEFAMRGGVLSTWRNSRKTLVCVLICGLTFGLFHQNVRQVFYTALFGMLAAYMTIKTKSIFPAMLMHFGNNLTSVYIDYATEYGWAVGGNMYAAESTPFLVVAIVSASALSVVLVVLMLYIRDRKIINKKREVFKDCAFDATGKRVILPGEFDSKRITELEMEKEVYGADYSPELYKPQPRDVAFILALGVVTLCTTVFTYVWGFLY